MPDIFDRLTSSEQESKGNGDIFDRLTKATPERGLVEKAARIPGQYLRAGGMASPLVAAYDIASGVHPPQVLTEEAKKKYKDQSFFKPYAPKEGETKPVDITSSGLIEKATDIGEPENFPERIAFWTGLISNPKKWPQLIKSIPNLLKSPEAAKQLAKGLLPSKIEAARGLGAASLGELGEELGPMGRLTGEIIGDIATHGGAKAGKAAIDIVRQPKEFLARQAAKMTKKDAIDIQRKIIEDFRKSGIQADLGTSTDNNLIKLIQSKLSQSGLVGKELDAFRQNITQEILAEYENLAKQLGEAKFLTQHEAGETMQTAIRGIREQEMARARSMYQKSIGRLTESSVVQGNRLVQSIENLEKKLTPGSLKAGETNATLTLLDKLKNDLHYGPDGLPVFRVQDLVNNKINLNAIIDYEVQGGQKQLLKQIVNELDRSIISYGKNDPIFAKGYIQANKNFSQHAKTFRNKAISQVLKEEDPSKLMKKMDSVQGIRQVEKVLDKTPEGKKIFGDLKRAKLEELIGSKMVNSTTDQIKLGTFSKLSEKGKGREILRELLGKEGFARLERLQRNAGHLAEAAEKYYNASKSGVHATDAAAIYGGFKALVAALTLNPWPLISFGSTFMGIKGLTKLLTNKDFLRQVEDVILASKQNNIPKLVQKMEVLKGPLMAAFRESQEQMKTEE